MTTISAPMMPQAVRPGAARVRTPIVSSAVLAMLIFIGVELMFFAGLMSALAVVKSSALPGAWPPPGQPRLPIEATALNSLVLLASGVLAWLGRFAHRNDPSAPRARRLLVVAALLGLAFVGVQGFEWLRLLDQGLTMRATAFGSFFYMILGAHALHVLGALGALGWCARRSARGALTDGQLAAVVALWTFVVALWPILCVRVYL